jgi:cell division protein FtsN
MKTQRGGLVLGLIVGVLVGLAVALAVALYVTKAPVPFVNKVPPRTADHDANSAPAPTDTARSPTVIAPPGTRDPAAILSGSASSLPDPPAVATKSAPAASPTSPPPAPATVPSPAPKAPVALPPVVVAPAASGPVSAKPGAETLVYFVQAGAFQGSAEAEQQKAKLAMLGVEAKVIEREQSGRMVFRVRAGPFSKQADAEVTRGKLSEAGVDTLLVRVDPKQP